MIRKNKQVLLPFIISFIFLNLFIAVASNTYFAIQKLKDDYYFTVELQNKISTKEISDFEKLLLANPYVKSVKYLSKEEAFLNLQDELEIVIPRSENPLPNSLIISFKEADDIQKIQETLDINPNVREIYIDYKFLEQNYQKTRLLEGTLVGLGILIFCSLYLAISGLSVAITKDYLYMFIRAPKNEKVVKIAKSKNIAYYIFGLIIGSLGMLNIYVYFRGRLLELIPGLNLISIPEMGLIIGVSSLIVWVISINMVGIKRIEESK